ncbi:hypothetical protein NM208_g13191 [Fusarium decemcellulare]|uniref:Uncharacterized protein n=1 Tax=Fusarium decemcellulare TaxID=57161 RepID=A0ACC1RKV8_9HYPO|nr:hypothetical protein NM208_g13191 [Fusarium decemcellulare]
MATTLLLLPLELVANVVDQFSDGGQAAAFSQCSRLMHDLAFGKVFDLKFRKRPVTKSRFNDLFNHAVNVDSVRIVDWLLSHELGYLLKEASSSFSIYWDWDTTHLDHALFNDAPKVTTHLLRLGYSDYAAEADCAPLYLALCRHNHDFSHDLDKPLQFAAQHNLLRTMRLLLHRGANPNAFSQCGVTAIYIAVQALFRGWGLEDELVKCKKSMSLLLDFGADVNLQSENCGVHFHEVHGWRLGCINSREGTTALHLAAFEDNREVTSFLLENGANPHNDASAAPLLLDIPPKLLNPVVQLSTGTTALHLACRFGKRDFVRILLTRGANVHTTDARGDTPLHEVMSHERYQLHDSIRTDLVRDLIDHGASQHIRNFQGDTAQHLAWRHPSPKVRRLFGIESRHTDYWWDRVPQGPRWPQDTRVRTPWLNNTSLINYGRTRNSSGIEWVPGALKSPSVPDINSHVEFPNLGVPNIRSLEEFPRLPTQQAFDIDSFEEFPDLGVPNMNSFEEFPSFPPYLPLAKHHKGLRTKQGRAYAKVRTPMKELSTMRQRSNGHKGKWVALEW